MHILVADRGRVGGEFADDFFQQVFERHQTFDIAVFIDYECVTPPVALELRQLLHQRCAVWDKVRFASRCEFNEFFTGQGTARKFLCGALHVQNADQVVEFTVVHRQAGMRRLPQPLQYIFPIARNIHAGDILTRNHDVIHRDAFQVEYRQQHLPMASRNQWTRFADHGAQLLGTEGVSPVPAAAHTEQA